MAAQNGVVEPIREASAGREARIIVELRTLFPGLGGSILTQEGVAAALRIGTFAFGFPRGDVRLTGESQEGQNVVRDPVRSRI